MSLKAAIHIKVFIAVARTDILAFNGQIGISVGVKNDGDILRGVGGEIKGFVVVVIGVVACGAVGVQLRKIHPNQLVLLYMIGEAVGAVAVVGHGALAYRQPLKGVTVDQERGAGVVGSRRNGQPRHKHARQDNGKG